jgi:hypothetical protein
VNFKNQSELHEIAMTYQNHLTNDSNPDLHKLDSSLQVIHEDIQQQNLVLEKILEESSGGGIWSKNTLVYILLPAFIGAIFGVLIAACGVFAPEPIEADKPTPALDRTTQKVVFAALSCTGSSILTLCLLGAPSHNTQKRKTLALSFFGSLFFFFPQQSLATLTTISEAFQRQQTKNNQLAGQLSTVRDKKTQALRATLQASGSPPTEIKEDVAEVLDTNITLIGNAEVATLQQQASSQTIELLEENPELLQDPEIKRKSIQLGQELQRQIEAVNPQESSDPIPTSNDRELLQELTDLDEKYSQESVN